jgi:hypothetical protein
VDEVRWELLRSLGAVVLTPPPGNRALCAALDLPIPTGVEHTDAFVLSAPPHGAIHLGPEGKLGGEGLDRIAGFWRVLGLQAPEDADHLGALLMLYAGRSCTERGPRSFMSTSGAGPLATCSPSPSWASTLWRRGRG